MMIEYRNSAYRCFSWISESTETTPAVEIPDGDWLALGGER